MKYAVMTTWKHNYPIDWDGAESLIGDDMPDGSTVQWFAIDDHNHGSFCTYPSQEVYEDFKATLDAYRKEQIDTRVEEMTMEAIGPIYVDEENSQVLEAVKTTSRRISTQPSGHPSLQLLFNCSGIKALVEEQQYVTSNNSTSKGDQLTWFIYC